MRESVSVIRDRRFNIATASVLLTLVLLAFSEVLTRTIYWLTGWFGGPFAICVVEGTNLKYHIVAYYDVILSSWCHGDIQMTARTFANFDLLAGEWWGPYLYRAIVLLGLITIIFAVYSAWVMVSDRRNVDKVG